MNLSQLYYFKKLAELQHYSRAAKALFITQPTLSAAISALDKELGVPLFYRKGRNIELTAYGETFYNYVRSALSTLDEGIEKVLNKKMEINDVIRLGTTVTTLDHYLHPLLHAFKEAYGSGVCINTLQGFTNNLTQGLHDAIFDVVFCGKRDEETDIEYFPVFYRNLVLCVREDHPLAKRESVSFQEMRKKDMVSYHRGTPIGEKVFRLAEENKLSRLRQLYDDDITMVSFLAFEGTGAALMLDSIGLKLFPNIKALKVREVPDEFYWVYLAYHKSYPRSVTVDAFIEFVREYEGNKVLRENLEEAQKEV